MPCGGVLFVGMGLVVLCFSLLRAVVAIKRGRVDAGAMGPESAGLLRSGVV